MLHYQQQQKSTEELLQAMKQQYIEFMTKGLQQLNNVSEPDPVSPSQTHIRCANGQRQEQLPWTDNEAQEQLQQHPQQPEEQLCLSRPQLCEDRPPAVQTPSILSRNHGGRADR